MSILYSPWTSQPQQAVGIYWGNPITRGLAAAFNYSGFDNVGGLALSRSGTLSVLPTSAGLSSGSSGTAYFSLATRNIVAPTNTAFSVVGTFRVNNAAQTNKYIAFLRDGGGAGNQAAVIFGYVANKIEFFAPQFTGADPRTGSQITVPDTNPHTFAYCYDGSNWSGYIDGVQVFSVSRTFSCNVASTNLVSTILSANGSNTLDGAIVQWTTFSRGLSSSEARSLTANPWQIFKPIPRRIFVPVSAGGSDTLLYPTKGSLVASGYVPTITQPGSNTTLSPAKGSLAITGKTPTLTQPNALSPSKAAAIFSGKQPTISQTANQTLSPSKVSLVFSGKQPTIDQTAANSILPGTGHYYTSGKQPTITQPNSLAPSKRAVALTGYQPTIQQSFSINPTTGAVVITGKTPSITQPNAITPLVAHAILTGKTPIISDSTPMTDSQKLDLIIDILSNKQTLNPATGIYTLYADDGVTPIYTAAAYEDAAGTVPYRGQALQRLDSLQEI